MRIVEKCWVDLQKGYQDARSLERRLKVDWKRAVQVAQKREKMTGQANHSLARKIAWATLLAIPLICIALWVVIFYLPESRAQFLSYFCVFVFLGIPTAGIALFFLLRNRERHQAAVPPPWGLVEQWWKALRPRTYAVETSGEEAEINFLESLSFLDNRHIAIWGLLTSAKRRSDTDVLLLGTTGIWIFEVKHWRGTISKSNGVWYSEDEWGRRKPREQIPDEQWQAQKDEITKTIRIRLGSKLWMADLIKGGVVFANKMAKIGSITGNKAPCGRPDAWRDRIRKAQPDRDFPLEDQLELLDALIHYANLHERQEVKIVSASTEAARLYEESVVALQKYVSERVK